ncbi:MAG: RNA pseudouridine synthase [Muribaculaceae bacterium]|nr:RNA pseudouridine synthase [Muribaculaceae bacterium]
MNNPFDYRPDKECREAFEKLIDWLEELKKSDRAEEVNFCKELADGKMLGVLIAEDSNGERHRLYAFSGQLGNGGFYHDGFVGPVFDYLQPGGYFKIHEAEISRQNREIEGFEAVNLAEIRTEYELVKAQLTSSVDAFKEKCRQSKAQRDARRQAGLIDDSEMAEMIRQSQFEKAEIHRLKKRLAEDLQPYEAKLNQATAQLEAMKERRRHDSEELQNWLFSNFKLLNARGESRSLNEIFTETPIKIPPSGTGECCAPKLLQATYMQGWKPISIAEYWYGKPKGGELRIHGEHYPACRGKCLPVLSWMLQGLEVVPPLENHSHSVTKLTPKIIYENEWFCVVNKPSGMLSVPGKGCEISLQQWLENQYGIDRGVKVAHRLDQDTSGLIIATFGVEAYKAMQSIFATRKTKKTYVALLVGDYRDKGLAEQGIIDLPIAPDWLDRPRQRVDFENGKSAVTEYQFTDVLNGKSRVIFHPITGRTHQLRVHSASDQGLGMPISGDRLYGKADSCTERLKLHAHKIEFTFPLDGQYYSFESDVPF